MALFSAGLPESPSRASERTTTVKTEALIRSLIIKRLPGRTALSARASIEANTSIDTSAGKKLGNRFETIVFDESLTVSQAEDLAASLEAEGLVASAEPDYPRYLSTDDTYWNQQWSLQSYDDSNTGIDIESAWVQMPSNFDVVVAVIDTGRPMYGGVDHPDMVGNVVDGYDFLGDTYALTRDGDGWDADETDEGDWSEAGECGSGSDPSPSSWHGAHVAGTIAAEANNGIGIAGINPRAKVQHIRVLGACGGSTSDEVAAILWAAGLPVPAQDGYEAPPINPTPADVINLSLGGDSPSPCSEAEQEAIYLANEAGSIVVVAAGNDNDYADLYSPANCDGVITVSAVEQNGSRLYIDSWSASNFGEMVEIAAPGADILSTVNAGSQEPIGWDVADSNMYYEFKSGTSMATPTVSGVVSLLLSYDNTLMLPDILDLLQQNSAPFPFGSTCSGDISDWNFCGPGIVNAAASLHALTGYEPITGLFPLSPERILNTRLTGKIGSRTGTANATVFNVYDQGGLPSTDISAVLLNVTVVDPEVGNEGGYVTVYPCAAGRPDASNLNFTNNQIIANTVIAPVDINGNICFYSYGKT
ncbi:MAG: S8 family peptidase, partial [Actinomycetota bacterium]